MEKERLCQNRYTYIFIDEVQNCDKFEKAVDSLFLQKNVDIYITGSNAYMLSRELATLLSGRYVTIDMLSLSFREYCTVNSGESNRQLFQDYLKYGSFPYVAVMGKSEAVIKSYIEGIYNTILIKDVAKREEILYCRYRNTKSFACRISVRPGAFIGKYRVFGIFDAG